MKNFATLIWQKNLPVVYGVVSWTLRPKLSVADNCGGLGVVEDLKMITGFNSFSFWCEVNVGLPAVVAAISFSFVSNLEGDKRFHS